MPSYHIVMIKQRPGISVEKALEFNAGAENLVNTCIHPETQKPYIVSITGGKDTSGGPYKNDFDFVYLMEFANEADREYFMKDDPVHHAFTEYILGEGTDNVEKVLVFDFSTGVY